VQGKELNVVLSLCTRQEKSGCANCSRKISRIVEESVYDETQRRVFLQRRTEFRDLVLEAERSDKPSADAAAQILAREVAAGRCVLKNWDDAVEQWIVRVNRLREWMPELGLPAITEDDRAHLVQQICLGSVSYKEIKDRPVWPVVKSWLTPQQQGWVDEYTPERIELPAGRKAKVTYHTDAPPPSPPASRICMA